MHGERRRNAREIGVQVRLELVQKNLEIRSNPLTVHGKVRGIDQSRPGLREERRAAIEVGVERRVVGEEAPRDTEPRAAQTIHIEMVYVLGLEAPASCGARGILRVGFGHRTEQDRGVAHRPRQWTGRVLAVRDRHDPAPADQPDGRFQTHDAVDRGGADDGAVRLGADGCDAKPRRHGDGRSGARAGRRTVERVGIARLPTAPAPAAGGVRRAKVSPFAQISLPEDDSAACPQPRNQRRVRRRVPALERQGPCGSHHVILGLDVVLDQQRHPVQWSARSVCATLAIEVCRDLECAWIDLQHRAQLRTPAIERVNPLEIHLGQGSRRQPAGLHGGGGLRERAWSARIEVRGRAWQGPPHGRQSTGGTEKVASIHRHPTLQTLLGNPSILNRRDTA